jgi:hypothetical protein
MASNRHLAPQLCHEPHLASKLPVEEVDWVRSVVRRDLKERVGCQDVFWSGRQNGFYRRECTAGMHDVPTEKEEDDALA